MRIVRVIRTIIVIFPILMNHPALADSVSVSYDPLGRIESATHEKNGTEAATTYQHDTTDNRTNLTRSDGGGMFAPPSFSPSVCSQGGLTYRAMGLYPSQFEAMRARNVCPECNGGALLSHSSETGVGCLPVGEPTISAVTCRVGDTILLYYYP